MILTLTEAKIQLRLEEDFDEHDQHIATLINAAQRSIERNYYCVLVNTSEERDTLPEGSRGFLIEDDVKLAAAMMVAQWYFTPKGEGSGTDSPSQLGVEHLLFPLIEHTA
ncbi:head-tail connector protein [Yersinia ruckeri]|uniref:head-tail connector protein n=1 Tax=Yersinia ruckeri TaxID=29486 RepID=UPI00119EBC82|nr:head-tail connector protein [Yersinia ruckeri]EKN4700361.1 phage gp6-like head-tail connector protein [Yersinia ruckeri]MCW6563897.1 head-tail connector protein [Yersinia ruckeri]MCW6573573.1 head-tail connector protein [Yersinia ruckeri]MCW6613705.1 head-tail connector protein [Yersinia ruckeri]UZX67218.1 head-tail connector protein [Yersinia ruckeri]